MLEGVDISAVIENVGIVAICILWVRAERLDNQQLWKIIEQLVQVRLRQVEEEQESLED